MATPVVQWEVTSKRMPTPICWLRNHAAQLLSDSTALARERRRVATLERAIESHVKRNHDQGDELVAALLAADAPGQGGEGR